MNTTKLLEGYYAGTLTDAQEEQLEMLMLSGDPEIPQPDRRLYLGITNLPSTPKPARKPRRTAWRISSIAASLTLILGLGTYAYIEQQRQIVTQQEILELAMGNMSRALHKSDTTRQQLAAIINVINTDTTKKENHNPDEI